uniref:Odorant binding protein n=1 Tax=Athetis dissimilis TaxID=1737331 RepID=A0A4D6Q5T3_ATHDI|nr:odorant binding protein [Athetis dissimilis]
MNNKVFILLFLTYISLVSSSKAPFITKCKWDDAKCLKESSQAAIPLFAEGLPDLNVAKQEPLIIKHVDASTSNLKLIITDVEVNGLKNCEARKITRDIENSKIIVKIRCSVDFKGKYDMKGQLFILPIEGNGDLTAHIRKMLITAEVDIMDKTGKDGKTHWNVKSWRHSFDLQDKSDVRFENLFPDNELLRKSTEELIASNGNDVINEIGHPVIKSVVAAVINNIKKFFDTVPLEDLVLD